MGLVDTPTKSNFLQKILIEQNGIYKNEPVFKKGKANWLDELSEVHEKYQKNSLSNKIDTRTSIHNFI